MEYKYSINTKPRRIAIAGNWKMNCIPSEAEILYQNLVAEMNSCDEKYRALNIEKLLHENFRVIVFPSFTSLHAVQTIENPILNYGAQNCHFESTGAYTGETSPQMIAALGCRYVLVGHSERRNYFGESNETCRKKMTAVREAGLVVVYCVGESLDERQKGKTFDVLSEQLGAWKQSNPHPNDIIAYEPVWSIGSGLIPTTEEINAVRQFILQYCNQHFEVENNEDSIFGVLYGGSVTSSNANVILSVCDGLLVGGASLKVEEFCKIYEIGLRIFANSAQ